MIQDNPCEQVLPQKRDLLELNLLLTDVERLYNLYNTKN